MLHWDEPEVLIETGGWLNQEMPKHFGKYARILYKSFGDRVKKWSTLNEPFAVVSAWYCGQISYINCPWTLYRSAHYMLLGHAEAYRIYEREFKGKQKGKEIKIQPLTVC
jgi:beta-glucosidase/6-phospho-beta-glucosidase/beta-galactosidase